MYIKTFNKFFFRSVTNTSTIFWRKNYIYNEFKTRYNQHKSLFKLVHSKKDTKLSEHILEL